MMRGWSMNFREVLRYGSNCYNLIILCLVMFLSGCAMPEGSQGSAAQSTSGFIFGTVYFILMGFFAYYFIVIKPAQLEDDNKKKFVEGLKKNDEVRTSGGLIGKVVSVKDNIVTLEIAQNVRVRVVAEEVLAFEIGEHTSGTKQSVQ